MSLGRLCERCRVVIEPSEHFAIIYTRKTDGATGNHCLCLQCYELFYTWMNNGKPMDRGGGGGQ